MASPGVEEFLLEGAEHVLSFVADLDAGRAAEAFSIDSIVLDMPCEVVAEMRDDTVERLFISPPSQHLTTGIMPVLHRLRLRLEVG